MAGPLVASVTLHNMSSLVVLDYARACEHYGTYLPLLAIYMATYSSTFSEFLVVRNLTGEYINHGQSAPHARSPWSVISSSILLPTNREFWLVAKPKPTCPVPRIILNERAQQLQSTAFCQISVVVAWPWLVRSRVRGGLTRIAISRCSYSCGYRSRQGA